MKLPAGCEDRMTDRPVVSNSLPVDLDELQARLRTMSDKELRTFGTTARNMCSLEARLGKPPQRRFVIHLEEATTEWKRRKSNPV
jgi:hypothetical protein